uniref:NADH-ubiquinone oxidoreductase chain 5 n=1 Tax=Mythicomyia sp. TaxID=2885616 RepID=A0A8K1KXE6_9MUSC|nr:NADH dehydrogenase subunit 5 [Mythicomyia sp.]
MNKLSICSISFIFLFLCSLFCFWSGVKFLYQDFTIFIEWDIISINSVSIVMTLLFDWMSLLFMSFVLLISSLVIFYSKEYMSHDYNINRFILLVLMFVLSMMFLIISPNLVSILLGWDGLGLVSYCLVIYFQSIKSYNAGMLTALSNRIGDVALLMSIAWMLNYGGWNYIFYLFHVGDFSLLVVGSFVILAAMTKSAQIPFSSWLPAAMAAPTPVSALVHSSTLVTAGVYLLIRFNSVVISFWMGSVLLLLSGLTMFMAGIGANYEFDLKKIIALSTLSQLGLMMSTLAMGYPKLAFFHLLTHALFKALLFMCAGAIIHNLGDFQDIRFMGSLMTCMPLTSCCFNIANLALCGMPFLAGFYSKDLILEVVCCSYLNFFSFLLYFVSTGLTVCYSFRLVYYAMTGGFGCYSLNQLNDEGWVMLRGMFGLLIMSLLGGAMLSWFIFPAPYMICLPWYLKFLTLFVCVSGGFIGYYISDVKLFFFNKSFYTYFISYFLGSMWFMPWVSTWGIYSPSLTLGNLVVKSFDQGWCEFWGGQMIYDRAVYLSKYNQVWQNNSIKIYLMTFVLWVFIFIGLGLLI